MNAERLLLLIIKGSSIIEDMRPIYIQDKTELRHARKRMREEQASTRLNARISRRVSYFIV